MQEGVLSSYNKIQPRGRFKAKSGERMKESSLGPYHFSECPFALGDEVHGLFSSYSKGHSHFNLAEKKSFLTPAIRTVRIQDKASIKLFKKHMLAIPV